MNKHDYKIGEVASLLATSIRTIRFYEEGGLIQPIRTGKGTRLYNNKHVTRLKVILSLTQSGFSIDSIRKIVQLRTNSKTGDESSRQVIHHFNEIQELINNQILKLNTISQEISMASDIVSKCKGCTNHPSSKGCPNCYVKSELGHIELLNLVWDTE
ncbi:MAG: MerR family transcriptional regulator [Thiohalomonas sp.]|nr:MerR family transcriptional regulator [Thiohalomonas sp.]